MTFWELLRCSGALGGIVLILLLSARLKQVLRRAVKNGHRRSCHV